MYIKNGVLLRPNCRGVDPECCGSHCKCSEALSMPILNRSSTMVQPFRFLDLPLEIRQMIHDNYLWAIQSSLQEKPLVGAILLKEKASLAIPILSTSKQVYREIRSLLNITSFFPINDTLSVTVSWHGLQYDPWVIVRAKDARS